MGWGSFVYRNQTTKKPNQISSNQIIRKHTVLTSIYFTDTPLYNCTHIFGKSLLGLRGKIFFAAVGRVKGLQVCFSVCPFFRKGGAKRLGEKANKSFCGLPGGRDALACARRQGVGDVFVVFVVVNIRASRVFFVCCWLRLTRERREVL